MRLLKKITTKVLLLCLCVTGPLFGQDALVTENNFGFTLGANLAFGTHFRRLGLNLNFYYLASSFQFNTEARVYYNFRNLGPTVKYPELVISQGLVYAFGTEGFFVNPFLSPISNQTFFQRSLAYSYNLYFNKIRTTQQTGTVAFQYSELSFIAENDLLARPAKDRFRTGAFLLQYQYRDIFQAALNCSMWTGKLGFRKHIADPNFYAGCYMDTTGSVYASVSHGILSTQFKYYAGYSQNVQVSAGIDAEQVRNAVQNHLIHDLRFLPKQFPKRKNCHLPMIATNGDQFLYREGQSVRKPKLFLNGFANASLFY